MMKIPPELAEILTSKRGFSLLIKGEPGTGKTMLALELAREFGGSNAVYLSTRVSPSSLYEQFPWLNKSVPPLNVIDATKLYVSSDVIPGVQSFPDILYSRLGKIEKPATIVIDSWEAITSQVEEEKMQSLAAAVTELARHNEVDLILVSECFETTSLDYIVDGIVTLRCLTMDYRRGRDLEINKLRGVRINQPRYAFTLEGGNFQYFKPFKRKSVKQKPVRIKPIPNTKTSLSTGSEEMDKILGGGFRRGSFNVIEVGDDQSIWGYQSLISYMLINCIEQGIYCVWLPCCGYDERRLKIDLLPFVNEEDYLKYLTILEISANKGEYEAGENVKFLEGESIEEDWDIVRSLVSELPSPVLITIGTDMLEYPYQLKEEKKLQEMVMGISHLINDTRAAGNVDLLEVKPKLALAELTNFSNAYLKLILLDDTIVFYGVRPATGLHCLDTIIAESSIKLKLTPFV